MTTTLICLVQRLFLRDRSLVKEGEQFSVSPEDAAIYIAGGIAKETAPIPVPETPKPEPIPAPAPVKKPVQRASAPKPS